MKLSLILLLSHTLVNASPFFQQLAGGPEYSHGIPRVPVFPGYLAYPEYPGIPGYPGLVGRSPPYPVLIPEFEDYDRSVPDSEETEDLLDLVLLRQRSSFDILPNITLAELVEESSAGEKLPAGTEKPAEVESNQDAKVTAQPDKNVTAVVEQQKVDEQPLSTVKPAVGDSNQDAKVTKHPDIKVTALVEQQKVDEQPLKKPAVGDSNQDAKVTTQPDINVTALVERQNVDVQPLSQREYLMQKLEEFFMAVEAIIAGKDLFADAEDVTLKFEGLDQLKIKTPITFASQQDPKRDIVRIEFEIGPVRVTDSATSTPADAPPEFTLFGKFEIRIREIESGLVAFINNYVLYDISASNFKPIPENLVEYSKFINTLFVPVRSALDEIGFEYLVEDFLEKVLMDPKFQNMFTKIPAKT